MLGFPRGAGVRAGVEGEREGRGEQEGESKDEWEGKEEEE